MIQIWTNRAQRKRGGRMNFETRFIFAETSSTNTVCTSSSTTSSASSDPPLGRSNGIDQSQGRPTVNGVDQSQGRPTVNGVVDQSFVSNSDVADLQTESAKNEGKVCVWVLLWLAYPILICYVRSMKKRDIFIPSVAYNHFIEIENPICFSAPSTRVRDQCHLRVDGFTVSYDGGA